MPPTRDQRKKILFVLEDFGAGGVQRVFINLAMYLSAHGFDVVVAPLRNTGVLKGELAGIPVTSVWRHRRLLRDHLAWLRMRDELNASWKGSKRIKRVFKYAYALSRLIKDERPDIVFSGDMHGNCALSEAKRLIKADKPKLIMSLHSHAINIRGPDDAKAILAQGYLGLSEKNLELVSGPWDREFVKRCFSVADAFVVVSHGLGVEVSELVGRRGDIHVIPNPVVNERLRALADNPTKHPWLVRKEVPVVISVGRFGPQKDFLTLLEAFSEVRKRRRSRLILVGFDPKSRSHLRYRDELVARAKVLGISEDICLEPVTADPYSLMAGSDVYVLSSPAEGFGNVLVEALYCRLPIVSTDCPSGPREILEGGKYGRLVPIKDPIAMAEEIIRVLDSLQTEYTEATKDRLRMRAEDFSEEKIMDKYEKMIALLP